MKIPILLVSCALGGISTGYAQLSVEGAANNPPWWFKTGYETSTSPRASTELRSIINIHQDPQDFQYAKVGHLRQIAKEAYEEIDVKIRGFRHATQRAADAPASEIPVKSTPPMDWLRLTIYGKNAYKFDLTPGESGWLDPVGDTTPNDSFVNAGQVKHIAERFYQYMRQEGFYGPKSDPDPISSNPDEHIYPWNEPGSAPANNQRLITIGELKNLFSFGYAQIGYSSKGRNAEDSAAASIWDDPHVSEIMTKPLGASSNLGWVELRNSPAGGWTGWKLKFGTEATDSISLSGSEDYKIVSLPKETEEMYLALIDGDDSIHQHFFPAVPKLTGTSLGFHPEQGSLGDFPHLDAGFLQTFQFPTMGQANGITPDGGRDGVAETASLSVPFFREDLAEVPVIGPFADLVTDKTTALKASCLEITGGSLKNGSSLILTKPILGPGAKIYFSISRDGSEPGEPVFGNSMSESNQTLVIGENEHLIVKARIVYRGRISPLVRGEFRSGLKNLVVKRIATSRSKTPFVEIFNAGLDEISLLGKKLKVASSEGGELIWSVPDAQATLLPGTSRIFPLTDINEADIQAEDFKIAVIPDSQYLVEKEARQEKEAASDGYVSKDLAGILSRMTRWISENHTDEKIAFVTHVGDLVQNGDLGKLSPKTRVEPHGNLPEYLVAHDAVKYLDRVNRDEHLPYSISIGNHDYDVNDVAWISSERFQQFFGPHRYSHQPWYGGGYSANRGPTSETSKVGYNSRSGLDSYQIFSAGGRTFLHLNLRYTVGKDNTWAIRAIDRHPGLPVIITTHSYRQSGRSDLSANYLGGDAAFNRMILPRMNRVFMVICGHVLLHQAHRNDLEEGDAAYYPFGIPYPHSNYPNLVEEGVSYSIPVFPRDLSSVLSADLDDVEIRVTKLSTSPEKPENSYGFRAKKISRTPGKISIEIGMQNHTYSGGGSSNIPFIQIIDAKGRRLLSGAGNSQYSNTQADGGKALAVPYFNLSMLKDSIPSDVSYGEYDSSSNREVATISESDKGDILLAVKSALGFSDLETEGLNVLEVLYNFQRAKIRKQTDGHVGVIHFIPNGNPDSPERPDRIVFDKVLPDDDGSLIDERELPEIFRPDGDPFPVIQDGLKFDADFLGGLVPDGTICPLPESMTPGSTIASEGSVMLISTDDEPIELASYDSGPANALVLKNPYKVVNSENSNPWQQLGSPWASSSHDVDGDSLPDSWERAQMAALDNPPASIADFIPAGNNDGDRWSNLEEFHNGTSAAASDGSPGPVITLNGTQFNILTRSADQRLTKTSSFTFDGDVDWSDQSVHTLQLVDDLNGGFCVSYVRSSDQKLILRRYTSPSSYTDYISPHEALFGFWNRMTRNGSTVFISIRQQVDWDANGDGSVTESDRANFITTFDLNQDATGQSWPRFMLGDEQGNPETTGLAVTRASLWGIAVRPSDKSLWASHSHGYSSGFTALPPNSNSSEPLANAGQLIGRADFTTHFFGNGREMIPFGDNRFATISYHGAGKITVWDPNDNQAPRTLAVASPLSEDVAGGFTSFIGLLKVRRADGKVSLLTSMVNKDRLMEVDLESEGNPVKTATHYYDIPQVIYYNRPGLMVQVNAGF